MQSLKCNTNRLLEIAIKFFADDSVKLFGLQRLCFINVPAILFFMKFEKRTIFRHYSNLLVSTREVLPPIGRLLQYIFIIVPDSVGVYSLFVSFVCLFVCLYVCVCVCLSVSPFSQPCRNTESFTLVSYPGMANHRSLLKLDLISKFSKLNNIRFKVVWCI